MFSASLELSLGDNYILVITQWLSLILPRIEIESKISLGDITISLGDINILQHSSEGFG